MRPGVDSTSELTATTSPEAGANTSLAALTLSTTAAASPSLQRLADRRHLDEHDVAQLLLRVVADADDAFAALDADVFVILGVAHLRHHASPLA